MYYISRLNVAILLKETILQEVMVSALAGGELHQGLCRLGLPSPEWKWFPAVYPLTGGQRTEYSSALYVYIRSTRGYFNDLRHFMLIVVREKVCIGVRKYKTKL